MSHLEKVPVIGIQGSPSTAQKAGLASLNLGFSGRKNRSRGNTSIPLSRSSKLALRNEGLVEHRTSDTRRSIVPPFRKPA